MATRAPVTQQSPQVPLCDYCHQKPKFSNHQYCSKTCAGQAATLCNHCHKKLKFQNFEYCGKNCANLANPGGAKAVNVPQAQSQAQAQAHTQTQPGGTAKKYSKGNGYNGQQQTQNAIDPVQLAKLVAQHIPQVQAFLSNNVAQPPAPTAAPPFNQMAPNGPVNNPFLNTTNLPTTQAMPLPTTNGTSIASFNPLPPAQPVNISAQPAAGSLGCIIPGCGKPVHVDAGGMKSSDYCSMRHREEAVATGMVLPCIMCLTMPQSENDYFCSKTCREESMNKFDVVDPEVDVE